MVKRDIKVVDCRIIVPPTPNINPLNGVAVLRSRSCSSRPPASSFKPSSRHCMPNRNSAKPAQSCSQPELYQKLVDNITSASVGSTNDFILVIYTKSGSWHQRGSILITIADK